MSIGQPHLSSVLLTQRLLLNRPACPQPVVVLLGPVGAGKSTALTSISQACGAEVVHARVDFHHDEPATDGPTTVETLTRVAFGLSRTWKARPGARFTRFALGLIAVQTSVEGQSRDEAKEALRASIKALTRNLWAEWVIADLLNTAVDVAKSARVLTAPTAKIVKELLPR